MIIANLISDLLQTQEVYAIGCRSYFGKDRSEEVRIYHDLILRELRNRKVLLVDDVSDSGNTLITAVNHVIMPRSPSELRTATIHIKPWTSFIPNYYVDQTDAWIIYPWERIESVKLLGELFLNRMDEEEAVRELRRLTRVKEEIIRDILITIKDVKKT